MKFLLVSPKNRTVYNFRGDLIKSIQSMGYEVIVTGPDQMDIEKIEALGVRFQEISMQKTGTSIVDDLRYCYHLFRLMRKEKPNAILGYTIKPVVYGAIAARLAGIENINCMVTGGGYTFTSNTLKAKILGMIVRLLYRIGLACSDRIIFQNFDDLEEFCSRRLTSRNKCSVVHGSGVNMAHFVPTPLPRHTVFFMLSRLLMSKGVSEYLKAARMVKRQHPEVRFTLLGKYETMPDALSKDEVEAYIADGTIEHYEETSDVRPYYSACSVYVLPSYREGTPRTVLEAMAMGRAILTTDTNGCRETVEDGINGFLVPVKSVDAIAEKMLWMIEHVDQVREMAQESIQICREKYDIHKVNSKMLAIMRL